MKTRLFTADLVRRPSQDGGAPPPRAPVEGRLSQAHAPRVSGRPAASSFFPRLHFVRGRWGRWEQIHFRVGKRGGGEKESLPRGERAGLNQDTGDGGLAPGAAPARWGGRRGGRARH